MRVTTSTLLAVLSAAAFLSTSALAVPTGIAGKSNASAPRAGCGGCHGTVSTETAVKIVGPTELIAGATQSYSVTLEGAPAIVGGFNVSAPGATLTPGDGSQLLSNELVHAAPKAAVSGKITFDFHLTAPTTVGSFVVYAVGNSANGDGEQSDLDNWNFATPLTVTVVAAATSPTGNESGSETPAQTPAPAPSETNEQTEADVAEETAGCSAAGGSFTALSLLLTGLALRRRRQG